MSELCNSYTKAYFKHFQHVLYTLALTGYQRKEEYMAPEALRKGLGLPPLLRTDTPYHQEQGQGEWCPDLHSGKSNRDWYLQRERMKRSKNQQEKPILALFASIIITVLLKQPQYSRKSKINTRHKHNLKKIKLLSLAAETLKGRRKMHVGHNCPLLLPLSIETSQKHGAAKTLSGLSYQACGWVCRANQKLLSG